MRIVRYTKKFKKDLARDKRRNFDFKLLKEVMEKIENEASLDKKYRDHGLTGEWIDHRELHIKPDWLLIYKLIPEDNVVVFVRVGTHSDLF